MGEKKEMRYDLSDNQQAKEASDFLAASMMRDKIVEIKIVRQRRSLKANAYLHLLLQIFGSEFGYSLAEAKTIYKRDVAPGIFVYYKNDQPFIRSSADLTSKEIADSIEQLKKYSAENGLVLPEPNDEEKLRYYERQVERSSKYL